MITATLESTVRRYPHAPEKGLWKLGWELAVEPSADANLALAGEIQAGATKRTQRSEWTLEWSQAPWGEVEVEHKSSESIYPSAPERDKLNQRERYSLAWEGEGGALALTGEAFRERVSYPNAPSKDYHKRGFRIKLELEGLKMALSREEVGYPAQTQTEKDHRTWSLTWEVTHAIAPGLGLALTGTWQQTRYPHDPSRDKLSVEWVLAVSLD